VCRCRAQAVHQTRAYFIKEHGYIVDNPRVGPTLREAYWRPGNAEPFLGLVEKLTGGPLSGDAWVAMLKQDVPSLLAEEKAAYEEAAAKEATCAPSASVDLDMRIKLVDGDEGATRSGWRAPLSDPRADPRMPHVPAPDDVAVTADLGARASPNAPPPPLA
jgi:hypothetical protein